MDDFLSTLGLWRKPTASCPSCLFRAVSEQIFHTQAYHVRLRKVCEDYLARNKVKLEEECKPSGQLDILALSHLFRKKFLIYRELGKPPVSVGAEGYKGEVVLCFTGGHHYDSVYPRQYMESAAICQSILYETLYKGVFGMEAPVETSAIMINPRPNKPRGEVTVSTSPGSLYTPNSLLRSPKGSADSLSYREVIHKSTVPFPYKVAKTLAPDIYRNVELDVWIETKLEQFASGCSVEEDEPLFSPGDKCRVLLDGRLLNAHIQEIEPEHGPATVFVEELGEKQIVPVSSLKTLPQNSKSTGWNSTEDGFRKRKSSMKKPYREYLSMSGTDTDGGSSSGHIYKNTMKSEFGTQHVINSAGHPIKNNYDLSLRLRHHSSGSSGSGATVETSFQRNPHSNKQYAAMQLPRGHQRVRSYSESGATNGPVGETADVYGKAGSPHCRSVDTAQDGAIMGTTYTPSTPSQENYAAYPQFIYPNEGSPVVLREAAMAPMQNIQMMVTASSVNGALPPHGMPAPAQFPMMSMTTSPAGPHQLMPPYPMRRPSNDMMQNGLQSPSHGATYQMSHVPYFPYLVVPHLETMGPVNYCILPSCDPRGADLPNHDPSTMRFFFNLGVEYYRMCSQVMSPSMSGMCLTNSDPYAVSQSPYVHQMVPPTMMSRPPLDTNYSGQFEPIKVLVKEYNRIDTMHAKTQNDFVTNTTSFHGPKSPENSPTAQSDSTEQSPDGSTPRNPVFDASQENNLECVANNCEESKHDESTDSSEDCDKTAHSDSGCVSDSSNSDTTRTTNSTENGSDKTSDESNTESHENDANSQCDLYDDELLELLRQPVFTRAPRSKPPKKNGPTKLIRPIKDIPPRFKKMLEAEAFTQAAALRKNQFEGVPLVRQIMMGRGRRHRNNEQMILANHEISQINFNPNAQAFIPGQPYRCLYEHSESGIGYVANDSSSGVIDGDGVRYFSGGGGGASGGVNDGVSHSAYPVQFMSSPRSASSPTDGKYYCECWSNCSCLSPTGTYYSSQTPQAAPGVGLQNATFYPTY